MSAGVCAGGDGSVTDPTCHVMIASAWADSRGTSFVPARTG